MEALLIVGRQPLSSTPMKASVVQYPSISMSICLCRLLYETRIYSSRNPSFLLRCAIAEYKDNCSMDFELL